MFSKLENSLYGSAVFKSSDLAGVVDDKCFIMDTQYDSSVEFMKDVSKHVNTHLPFAITYSNYSPLSFIFKYNIFSLGINKGETTDTFLKNIQTHLLAHFPFNKRYFNLWYESSFS